jgi:hypothetical protein
MKNILFSTTRQWNCGDEFILFGCINILEKILGENFNSIIYNRHPDILHEFVNKDFIYASSDLCFRDNSFKHYMDSGFIDLVVFAGTPEWSTDHCKPLYEIINKYKIPVIALGIGSEIQNEDTIFKEEIHKFRLLTVRDHALENKLKEYNAIYMACPSIASANIDYEKIITDVKKIALIYSGDITRSVLWNEVSNETYIYLMKLYKQILTKYSKKYKFSIVCHYADELPHATSEFPNENCLYSYDARDYLNIYKEHDFVIGCRIHGIGICASMGIPGIAVAHDHRRGTLDGFLAELITNETDLETFFRLFDKSVLSASDKNKELLLHKQETIKKYVDLIQEKAGDILGLADKSKEHRIISTQERSNFLPKMIEKTNSLLAEVNTLHEEINASNEAIKSLYEEKNHLHNEINSLRQEITEKTSLRYFAKKVRTFFKNRILRPPPPPHVIYNTFFQYKLLTTQYKVYPLIRGKRFFPTKRIIVHSIEQRWRVCTEKGEMKT